MKKILSVMLMFVMVFSMMVPVFADEQSQDTEYTAWTVFENLNFKLDGKPAFCLEEDKSHPSKNGTAYSLSDMEVSEDLKKICVSAYLNDDTASLGDLYYTSVQYAVWSVIANDNYVECARSAFGDKVADMTAKILNEYKDINLDKWNVDAKVYVPKIDGYQNLLVYSVSKIPDHIAKTDFDDISIDIDGDRAYCLERDKGHPKEEGIGYHEVEEVVSEDILSVCVSVYQNGYPITASDFAVWSAAEGKDLSKFASAYGEDVVNMVTKILEDAKNVDLSEWNITTRVFESDVEGYQKLMTFSISKVEILPDPVPPTPQPDPVPPTPQPEPEPPTSQPDETLSVPSAPQTGDTSDIFVYITLMIVSACGLVVLGMSKKHHK